MLEFQSASHAARLRLYINGDTLLYKELREIPHRFPHIDLALLHLGGTKVMGIMLTMDGKQGAQALKIIAPDMTIPVHFDDYTVFKSPLDDFKKAVQQAGLENRVRYLQRGETYIFDVPIEAHT
jgi:L-ascorbate metabolism protein UlaG (beta-lactamase superfamily)